MVFALEELGVDVERLRVRPHVGHGGLGALAHDVAEHAGEDQALLAARHHGSHARRRRARAGR
jgi:CO/xanthine dehydrogenase Mo-binding subunit